MYSWNISISKQILALNKQCSFILTNAISFKIRIYIFSSLIKCPNLSYALELVTRFHSINHIFPPHLIDRDISLLPALHADGINTISEIWHQNLPDIIGGGGGSRISKHAMYECLYAQLSVIFVQPFLLSAVRRHPSLPSW